MQGTYAQLRYTLSGKYIPTGNPIRGINYNECRAWNGQQASCLLHALGNGRSCCMRDRTVCTVSAINADCHQLVDCHCLCCIIFLPSSSSDIP